MSLRKKLSIYLYSHNSSTFLKLLPPRLHLKERTEVFRVQPSTISAFCRGRWKTFRCFPATNIRRINQTLCHHNGITQFVGQHYKHIFTNVCTFLSANCILLKHNLSSLCVIVVNVDHFVSCVLTLKENKRIILPTYSLKPSSKDRIHRVHVNPIKLKKNKNQHKIHFELFALFYDANFLSTN